MNTITIYFPPRSTYINTKNHTTLTVPPHLLKMLSRRNRSSVQPNKLESTEGLRGKPLSWGDNYFPDMNIINIFSAIKASPEDMLIT
jgi:hypothetical protein